MRILLVLALSACSSKPATTTTTTTNTTAPPPEGGSATPGATSTCEEGMTMWDATAKECRLYPGGAYGKAGCSERTTEAPARKQCFTGTHWDGHCDCVCDKGEWHAPMSHCM